MRQTINNSHVEGYVFSHTLQARVSRKGVPFIMGDLNVATDDSATNVVSVHFSYVTETYKSGNPNQTYAFLMEVIDGKVPTYETSGTGATKVRIDGDVEVNDFVTRDGEMASPKRLGGRFVHTMVNAIGEHPATFDADMLIAGTSEKEFEGEDPYLTLRGYFFDFRGGLLPVELNVKSKNGIAYFEGQDISNSNPLFTHIKGEVVSSTIETRHEEESAFGDPIINVTTRNVRSWDVIWASAEPYEFGEDGVLTKEELKTKLAEREEYLAKVRQDHEEYQARRNGGQNFKAAAKPAPAASVDDDDDDFPF